MIDFAENEDGSITYESRSGLVEGLQVGTCAVRKGVRSTPVNILCRHCDRLISIDRPYAVDDLKSGEQMVPFRSRASAVVFADSISIEGYERGLTEELQAWLCEQDRREAETGETIISLRQWRRDKNSASNSDPEMRL